MSRKDGCLICENEHMWLVIDPLLDRGYSAKLVRIRLEESLPEASVRVILNHRRHHLAPDPFGDPKAPKSTDLAKLVVERTIEAVESGDLEPGDRDWSAGVTPGLAAQRVVEQRESQRDAKQLLAALAAALMGGSPTGFLAPAGLIGDGAIEGDFEEVDGPTP